MKKKFFSILFILFFLSLVTFLTVLYFQFQPLVNSDVYSLHIPKGTTIAEVGKTLKKNKVIRSDRLFYFYCRLNKVQIKAGVYTVSGNMTIPQILELLESGRQEYISVSIPEGYVQSKIVELLVSKGILTDKASFYSASESSENLIRYKIPGKNFEGYLFPDTYYLLPDMDPNDVITVLTDNFFQKIETVQGLKDLTPEELHQKIILASIVEREYRVPEEAPLIASVFVNRLKIGQGLYSCATIVYIKTEILGLPHPDHITYADTKIDSLYNTYLWAGLPPGPISNPGLVALSAAANPPKTKYRYFRLVDESTGKHVFSNDFSEHIEAGKTYSIKK